MRMKPIRIIDKDFNLLGEIDDYESLIFIRRFFKVGEFELRINTNKFNTDKLISDNLIMLGNGGNKVGIILHRENTYDEMGEPTDTLLIKGYTLKGICSRRLIVPPDGQTYESSAGMQEAIMKYFVNKSIVEPTDINRKIDNVEIVPNLDRGIQDAWRSRYEVLSDKLEEIGEYSQLGWDITLDYNNNKFVFDVIEGKCLTADQDILPPVIFSADFDNIMNRHFTDSLLNHKNVAYAGGKGDETDRLIQQIGNETGFSRIETFVDCSQAEDVDELVKEGNKELEELAEIKNFEVQILPYGSFVYEKDYNLGDVVTIQDKKLNLTMNTRIIEFKEIYESDGFKLEATFGNNIPTLLDKMKQIKNKQDLSGTGEKGDTGEPGKDGEGLDFNWNGAQLGIKKESDSGYIYVNLQGPQGIQGPRGDTGPQGLQGSQGKNIEYIWNGTQLGIRIEGDSEYQFVNLKGEKGDQGIQGEQGLQGIQGGTGPIGPKGKSIEYIWDGTRLGVRIEGETSYAYVDLKGEKGDTGEQGIQGSKGDVGATGVQGPKGDTGATGATGPKGDKGGPGPTGPQGLRGNTGPQGPIGPQGPVGEKGDTGAIGPKGEQGPVGPQGERGDNAVMVEAAGFYYFYIEDGNLYVRYADDGVPPNLKIDADGELILTI